MVSIIWNKQKDGAALVSKIRNKVGKSSRSSAVINTFPFSRADKQTINKSDLLVVIGGDGTILSTISQVTQAPEIPILPVHFGTLGFISSVTSTQVLKLLDSYLKRGSRKEYQIDQRPLLEVECGGKTYSALNEAVISKGDYAKLMTIEARFERVKTLKFRSDGLILATATGSTAYNLSAGGPILHPSIEAIIFNPVCPHSLTLKPILIPGDQTINVKASPADSRSPAYLMIDGIRASKISNPVTIKVGLSPRKISFIKPKDEHYYSILKKKLHWGIETGLEK